MRRWGAAVVLAGFLAFAACAGTASAAPVDSAITVTGNRHIGADMIRSYFHAGPDGHLDAAALDAALKQLYASGLFNDVKISHAGERILVIVVENPQIAIVAFEGNKRIKDADLKKELQSKAGGPLSRAVVQSDVVRITELYGQRGYFNVRVVPKTIEVKRGDPDSRVNVVFEIAEGEKVGVRQIVFAGNNAFSATRLGGVIKTGLTNVFSLLLDNDVYDPDRVSNDGDLLRRFYRAHGYADARVSAAARYDADKNGIVVSFKIDEGRQYRLGKVDIETALKSVDAAALRPVLRTQAGDVFDADAMDKTVEELSIALAKNGEPFASVATRTERRAQQQVIDLVYTIGPGKRLYVERIDIRGNIKTRDEVIRREFDFGEGDAYNRALVDRAERHLKALGFFKTVKITTQPGSAPDRVVLDVTVEEDKTGSFFVSGGYSASDGALAQVTLSDRNFLGTGDLAKATATYGQYARGFELGFTDPWFLGQRLAVGVDLFGRQTYANSYQSFNTTQYGAKFIAGTPVNDNIGVTWNYSIYNQGVTLDPALGTASLPIQQAAQAGSYWVSSIGNGLTYSTLDNAKNPSNGILAQSNNEFAGLGGAAKFARNTEDVRVYHEIAGDVVGMVRAQSGYATPWGGQQLPLLDGFFGGPQLVRGFAPNGFGPRDITPGTTMDNLGGNIYWTTTAELQSPMPFVSPDAQLKVALFSDTGSLWATNASSVTSLASSLSPSQQIANSRAIRASVGASLIWNSMFGPIRVDYAYPIAHAELRRRPAVSVPRRRIFAGRGSDHGPDLSREHDLIRKPISTFRDHALAPPQRRELGGDGPLIGQFALQNSLLPRALRHAGDEVRRQRGIVVRQIAPDQLGDQRRFLRRKQFLADLAGARHVGLQRFLRVDDRAHGRGGLRGRPRDQGIGSGDGRRGIVEARLRAVAAPHVEHDRADAAPHRDFRAHAVGPEAVDLAFLQRLGRGEAEIDAGADRARHRRDLHLVADKIDAGLGQQSAQAFIDPRRGADAASFDDGEIAAAGAKIGMHDQEPIHALRLRADELDAMKSRKRGERRMRRAADEIDRPVAQRLVGLVDRKYQFQGDVEPFGFEEAQFDCRFGRKIRIRDHVRHGNLHGLPSISSAAWRNGYAGIARSDCGRRRRAISCAPLSTSSALFNFRSRDLFGIILT